MLYRRPVFPVRYVRHEGGIASSETRLTVWADGRARLRRWAVAEGTHERAFRTADLGVLHQTLQELRRTTPTVRYLKPFVNAFYEEVRFGSTALVVLQSLPAAVLAGDATPSSTHDLPVVAQPSEALATALTLLDAMSYPPSR